MYLKQRIDAFVKLGKFLNQFKGLNTHKDESLEINNLFYTDFQDLLDLAQRHNAWFTPEQLHFAMGSWGEALKRENLETWIKKYKLQEDQDKKKVAVIMAGNLPLVGFHDFLSVLITGHSVIAKLSSNDKLILPFIAKILIHIEPEFDGNINFTEVKLPEFDAVIATGSNNTARYFEYYFKTKPHIIRKNRNAVAVLSGDETEKQLELLSEDIFRYFGMGCRSVSKLYVPKEYDFDKFFNAIYKHNEIVNHNKYANNYDYNKAVYLMSLFPILDNGFLILKEDKNFSSPIATVFYERYDDKANLKKKLEQAKQNIQCIVAKDFSENEIPFGSSQHPKLWDYADGVDTIAFLLKI
tara:strand:+ start:1004 stop:2065 length:1062 start_codon:yes stop_codon:yes gene_type:complete